MGLETVVIGSLLAKGGTAVAGASAAGGAAAAAGTLGSIASALQVASTVGGVIGGIQQFTATRAAASAAKAQARQQAALTGLDIQRAETQQATDRAERERRLRRTLAAQRASFAGAGVDVFSGSPFSIQEQTVGEINREQRLADLEADTTIGQLKIQQQGELDAGISKANTLKRQANIGLLNTGVSLLSNTVGILDRQAELDKLRKGSVPIPGRKPI
jgi:hypothetical protein